HYAIQTDRKGEQLQQRQKSHPTPPSHPQEKHKAGHVGSPEKVSGIILHTDTHEHTHTVRVTMSALILKRLIEVTFDISVIIYLPPFHMNTQKHTRAPHTHTHIVHLTLFSLETEHTDTHTNTHTQTSTHRIWCLVP